MVVSKFVKQEKKRNVDQANSAQGSISSETKINASP